MEGWRPVEDVIRRGFGQAPVVMANEFHSGLARCVRTRVTGPLLAEGEPAETPLAEDGA